MDDEHNYVVLVGNLTGFLSATAADLTNELSLERRKAIMRHLISAFQRSPVSTSERWIKRWESLLKDLESLPT